MQKISSLILAVGLALPAWYFISFYVHRHLHHQNAEERFEASHLETLEFDTTELQWTRKGKEILFRGRYFDIKKMEYRGHRVVVTGLYDDHESSLHKSLNDFWDNDWRKTGKPKLLADWCTKTWIHALYRLDFERDMKKSPHFGWGIMENLQLGFPAKIKTPPRRRSSHFHSCNSLPA